MIGNLYKGSNAALIADAWSLYGRNGDKVADVTYGKGAFWKNVDTTSFELLPSDLYTCPESPYDFRALPYDSGGTDGNGSPVGLDHFIFDPPYMHTPGKNLTDSAYQNHVHRGLYHSDIISQYAAGMAEARRTLKHHGFLWVKGKDEIESGRQCWAIAEIYNIANALGFYGKDLFFLEAKMPEQKSYQLHSRKMLSFLWIFQRVITTTCSPPKGVRK